MLKRLSFLALCSFVLVGCPRHRHRFPDRIDDPRPPVYLDNRK